MRRGLKLLLAIFMAVTLLPQLTSTPLIDTAKAADNYPMGCGGNQYETSWLNNDGSFSKLGCYDNLQAALQEMWNNGDDAVVRHGASKSPMKIIAMNSGVAAGYTFRLSSDTVDITLSSGVSTYTSSHRDMVYTEISSYNTTNGTGKIGVYVSGFYGYVELSAVDLIPTKFLEKNVRVQLGGNAVNYPSESTFWIYPKQSYYEVVQNGNYKEIIYHYWSFWANNSKSENPVANYSTTIGPAESWMNVGDIYYTNDMNTLYRDRYFRNPVTIDGKQAKYYNYYAYLPLRSRSCINGTQLDNFLTNKKGYTGKPSSNNYSDLKEHQSQLYSEGWNFYNLQEPYGINSLMVYSMAIVESGWGTSKISVEKNNLFGWKAYDSSPGQSAETYPNVAAGLETHYSIQLKGFLDINKWKFYGSQLGDKGSGLNVKYASDPYWGYTISGIAYQIDKSAAGNNGSLVDYGKMNLGIISETNVEVKQSPDSNSKTLYRTSYAGGSSYQKDFTVVILGESNGWTKIQTTNGVRSDGSLIVSSGDKDIYDWNISVGYVPNSKVIRVGSTSNEGNTPVGNFVQSITELSLSGTNLTIKGFAYQPGIYVTDVSALTHQLIVEDAAGNKQAYNLSQQEYSDANYKAAGFAESNIPLNLLLNEKGIYKLYIRTLHSSGAYDETKPIANVTPPAKGNELLYDYVFADDGTGMTVTKKDRVVDEQYNTLLKNFTVNSDGKLVIKGTAFVEGRHQGTAAQISHQLLITNAETGETVKTADLTSYTGDNGDPNLNLGYNHSALGFDYSYGYYKGEIDISDLPIGDYSFVIRTVADGKEFTRKLYGLSKMTDSGVIALTNGKYVELKRQYEFSNRYDLAVRNYQIVLPEGKQPLPRIRESYQYLAKFAMSENNESLIVKGAGFIWNGNFSADQHPKFTLYLINKDTGAVHAYQQDGITALTGGDYSWDITAEKGGTYDYSHTWYEITVPLAELENGNYETKLLIETDTYADLLDLKSKASIKLPSLDGEKKLTAVRNTKNKYKIELQLSGWYVAPISNELPELEPNDESDPNTDQGNTPAPSATPEIQNSDPKTTPESTPESTPSSSPQAAE